MIRLIAWVLALGFASGALAFAEIGTIRVAELPLEAQATLQRIRDGGPHAYGKDGSVFANREHRLPERVRGYYREYTVATPGVRGRGARRIVAGCDDEFYYTKNHYRRFLRIIE